MLLKLGKLPAAKAYTLFTVILSCLQLIYAEGETKILSLLYARLIPSQLVGSDKYRESAASMDCAQMTSSNVHGAQCQEIPYLLTEPLDMLDMSPD